MCKNIETFERQKILISNIQILRGIAALNVVLFHCIGSSIDYGFNPYFLYYISGWGMSGVDIFFVLSGFIMGHSQLSKKLSPKEFLINRIIRIVPLYWGMTSLYIVLLIVLPNVFREAEFDIGAAISSFLFLSQAIRDTFPYVGLGWTLEFEMLFYLIFGLSLILSDLRTVFFCITLVFLGLHFFVGTNAIIFEFLFGMAISWILKYRVFNHSTFVLTLGLGTFLFLSTIFVDTGLPRWINWGIPSAMLVFGVTGARQATTRLGKILGDASYSIYLIQIFTVPFLFKVFLSSNLGYVPPDILIVLTLSITALSGVFLYFIFERPVTNALRSI